MKQLGLDFHTFYTKTNLPFNWIFHACFEVLWYIVPFEIVKLLFHANTSPLKGHLSSIFIVTISFLLVFPYSSESTFAHYFLIVLFEVKHSTFSFNPIFFNLTADTPEFLLFMRFPRTASRSAFPSADNQDHVDTSHLSFCRFWILLPAS